MNELQVMLKDLYLVFGLNLSIFDLDGNLVTSYPEKNSPFCELVKSKPEVLKTFYALLAKDRLFCRKTVFNK